MTSSFANEISSMDKFHNKLTEYVGVLQSRAGLKMLDKFAEMRDFSIEQIEESGIFYIEDATEMLVPVYINMLDDFGIISPTNRKPIFHDRYVIPIRDITGKVINLVGYSKDADERYVYGTAKYYRRRETLYGLENLNLAYELGYAIITEGITDTIRVRDLGFKNSFAMCGTHKSDFIMRQLNRCRHGIIKIPDRDFPGKRAAKDWKCNRSITLNTFIQYKDIDALCRDSVENKEWAVDYISACIDWIKTSEHRGYNSQSEEITME